MAKLRLAGVSFSNPDGQSRKEILGRLFMEVWTEGHEVPVELVPEDDNPHDPHAVAVWTYQDQSGEDDFCGLPQDLQGKQVGYVPAEHALKVREALERGLVGHARLAHMAAGRGGISALIGIARADRTERDPADRVADELATTEELRGRLDRYGAAVDGSPSALRAVSDEFDYDADADGFVEGEY